MVPALFLDDEKESVLGQIRDEAMKMGAGPCKDGVWQYFVNKSANNLHIVLGMSPVGETLRTRCRNFPGTRISVLFYFYFRQIFIILVTLFIKKILCFRRVRSCE